MEDKKLKWCFKIKDGLKIVEPNERLSKSYLEQSKSSLLRAKKDFEDKDLLWTTVTMYYAEYYALYSFLQRIGVKCENHSCSILAVSFLLGTERTKTINEHKDKRIDAQYYMKVDQENKINLMLIEAQNFISSFDELVSNLSEEEINKFRDEIKHASL
jgi:uncharacterized protein (UPF0332 family)